MLGGGGVDGAIHDAAGPELYQACLAIRESEYPDGLPTGQVVLTGGFNLPALFIIHTVGPVWKGGNDNEEQQLYQCYYNSLMLAKDHGLKTIAFPAISTGAYRFPKDKANTIAQRAITDFIQAFPDQLETIYLVTYSSLAY